MYALIEHRQETCQVIPPKELPDFLKSLTTRDIHTTAEYAVQFTVLAAAHSGEVRGEDVAVENRVDLGGLGIAFRSPTKNSIYYSLHSSAAKGKSLSSARASRHVGKCSVSNEVKRPL